MASIKITDLLANLENPGVEKTSGLAAPQTQDPQVNTGKVAAARAELLAAAQDIHGDGSEKTASGNDVAGELLKMAADLANTEEQAMQKQAQLLGAAVADSFVARLHQHGAVAENEKTASSDVKLAMEAGYNDGLAWVDDRVKQAGLQQPGLQQPVAPNEKVAAFQQGYQDSTEQIQTMAHTPEGQQKLASIRQGYADTMAHAEKFANDCADHGYNDTIAVLQQLT